MSSLLHILSALSSFFSTFLLLISFVTLSAILSTSQLSLLFWRACLLLSFLPYFSFYMGTLIRASYSVALC